jgi:hypothetical protein
MSSEEAQANVLSLATLSELHQKRYGHAIPLQRELEAALRHLRMVETREQNEMSREVRRMCASRVPGNCLRCGQVFPPRLGPQGPVRKWCSNRCRHLAKREGHPAAGRGKPPFAKGGRL